MTTTAIAVKNETTLAEKKPLPKWYQESLERVRNILTRGRARAKAALRYEEIRTWWEAAKEINTAYRRHGKGRAGYGKQTVIQYAEDLGVSEGYLDDILNFQRVLPIPKSTTELALSHYCVLGRVKTTQARNSLLRRAEKEKWSVSKLKKEIQRRKLFLSKPGEIEEGRTEKTFPPLKPRRGKFYTYRLVEIENVHNGQKELKVDLGFRVRESFPLTGLKDPKHGDIVEVVRTEKNPAGDRYRFKKSTENKSALFTYAAKITKFHDADTYWLNLDLGFRGSFEEKIRLRGINAKELGDGGEAALEYVKEKLSRVPFVVVTTFWDDKWGRMLIDLFYLEGTDDPEKILREGTYLNQELLDLGLAEREE